MAEFELAVLQVVVDMGLLVLDSCGELERAASVEARVKEVSHRRTNAADSRADSRIAAPLAWRSA